MTRNLLPALLLRSGLAPRVGVHDIAPLIPIVEVFGGLVASVNGGSASQGGMIIAAANLGLYESVLAVLDDTTAMENRIP